MAASLKKVPAKEQAEEPIKTADELYPKVSLVKAKQEGLSRILKFESRLKTFKVKDDATYAQADLYRAEIKSDMKWWDGKIKPGIKYIRLGLDALRDVDKEVEDTYKRNLKVVTEMMNDYAMQKIIAKREADRKTEAEQAKLKMIADAKLRMANMAKGKIRDRYLTQAAEAEVEAQELVLDDAPVVEAANSQSRTQNKVRLTDLRELVKYIAKQEESGGADLTSLIQVNIPQLNAYFKLENDKKPLPLGPWIPGVEVWEEVNTYSKRT